MTLRRFTSRPDARFLIAGILLAGAAAALYSASLAARDSHEDLLYAEPFTGDLPQIRKRKLLRALVTYSKTEFFFDNGAPRGLQVALLDEYLKILNRRVRREEDKVQLVYIPVAFNRLLPALLEGKGDIAASLLTLTPEREKKVNFATGGQFEVSELIVTHKGIKGLDSIDDLSGRRVYVLRDSSYVQHLQELNKAFKKRKLAPVRIHQAPAELLGEDILELVNAGTVKITVIDDYQARLWQKVLPDIEVHEDLAVSEGNHVGWAIRKDNPELHKSLNAFAGKVKKGTLLGNMLFKRFYGDSRWIDNPVSKKELARLDKLLDLFRKYGKQYDFDYWALVAQAYQESRLDNRKRSHRGAVGIMQMLPSTARDKHVDIKNIAKLENNIHAATKYLAFLRDRYFSDPAITPPNRLAFTWAAYNAGPANVRRFRDLAKKMGLDPNVWFSNVEVAASKKVGRETVRYVAHVHKYYVSYKLASEFAEDEAILLSRRIDPINHL